MAYFTIYLILCCIFVANSFAEIIDLRSAPRRSHALVQRPIPNHSKRTHEELDILDTVLVASVDGKFHALNRTSGSIIWSMSATSSSHQPVPSALAPLVRTVHLDHDAELADGTMPHELYIIEPQTGNIYVMANPSSPLKLFPFSMTELVDMSPFTFSENGERRLFVGRKETSLLQIELETGRIKAVLNSECVWDRAERSTVEIDLDDLEASDRQKSTPTDVYIGRTDYYISIYTSSPFSRNSATGDVPVQNLHFSVYGPNNQDSHLQSIYRHTKDHLYIQSLPSGEIVALKSGTTVNSDSPFLWGHSFRDPVVAVFDVLRKPSPPPSKNVFVLLQPRRPIEEMLPNYTPTSHVPQSPPRFAFVGMVGEAGSLFAMSQEFFPLIAFRGGDTRGNYLLDAPGQDYPKVVDDIPKVQRLRPKKTKTLGRCEGDGLYTDRRCLVGVRELQVVDGPESRMRRLLDPPKDSEVHTRIRSGFEDGLKIADALSTGPGNSAVFPSHSAISKHDQGLVSRTNVLVTRGLSLAMGLFTLWFTLQKFRSLRRKYRLPSSTGKDLKAQLNITTEPPQSNSILSSEPSVLSSSTKSYENVQENVAVSRSTAMVEAHNPVPNPSVNEHRDETGGEIEAYIGDVDTPATSARRKTRRGKRGKKKKPVSTAVGSEDGEGRVKMQSSVANYLGSPSINGSLPSPQNLIVSETVLGFGSHGTVVFQGSLQGRAVAVKRLLQDFVTLAAREVSILQESDDHPNVIRYYYKEAKANFLYIALELCPASLADVIEFPDREQWHEISISFEPKKALREITSGLKHLHALKIVHRDIKPQNILVSTAKPGASGKGAYRMLISDFGLCKKLDLDQSSFQPTAHGAMAAGTVGWRAPEILRGEVKLDDVADDQSVSSRGSTGTVSGGLSGPNTGKSTRLTKSVDIFALGCLFYYTLTNGGHPFGDRFEREINILKNTKNLDGLEIYGEEGVEAVDLIEVMLDPEASERPETVTCLLHPFFWNSGTRLNFLQDASDRFEIMCRDPKDSHLINLETGAFRIHGNDWHSRLDKIFIENLGKFRKYDKRSVQDLLRALRNKKHHYQDLPDNVRRHLGPMPDGFLAYFTRRFPLLFLHVHTVVANSSLRTESVFRSYFDLRD